VAPNTVQIAETTYNQGFFLNARLDVLSFYASATIGVDRAHGIAVDGSLSKIVIGTPNLFSIANSDGTAGPRLSLATYSQPLQPPLDGPHALIDGKITTLGLSRQLYISISSSGFFFKVSGNFIAGIDYNLEGAFSSLTSMSLSGAVTVAISRINLGALGRVDVGSSVGLAADVGVTDTNIRANFRFRLAFLDTVFSLSVSLDANTGSLSELPGKVLDEIIAALKKFFTDALNWARAVAQKLIDGIKDVEEVLINVFGLSKDAAEAILDTINGIPGCAMGAALLAA
jgi:hypothetical protein